MNRTTRSRVLMTSAAIALSIGLLAGCSVKKESADNAEKSADKTSSSTKTAKLAYGNWAEGVDYTHLAKVVLEEKLGYEVDITMADVGPAFAAVATGKEDAFMETWLPLLHVEYYEKYGDKLLDLGHVYEGTVCGFVVPKYVTIDKISELNGAKEKFAGKIVGIDPGASMMEKIRGLIDDGTLEFDLVPSSSPAMLAQVKDAIKNKEWIVFPGWKPHWMFARWDLKFLEQDPDNPLWKEGNIHITARQNLKQDKPELAQFLENMILTNDELSDLMFKVKDSDEDVETVARKWMNDHPDVIEAWLPKSK